MLSAVLGTRQGPDGRRQVQKVSVSAVPARKWHDGKWHIASCLCEDSQIHREPCVPSKGGKEWAKEAAGFLSFLWNNMTVFLRETWE